MKLFQATILMIIGLFYGVTASAQDELLLDATYVPCSDSTESFYVFEDGRIIYAWGGDGVVFSLGSGMLDDLKGVTENVVSHIDTTQLDSCTTLGVILNGPRYLLINVENPSPKVVELRDRLERIRKYARKKLERGVDRLIDIIESNPENSIKSDPAISPEILEQYIYDSPIAMEWRCRGTVNVTARIAADGTVRQAFVLDADVKGKCSSLLTMTALRAVLLSTFEPAVKSGGSPGAAWLKISVTFGRQPWVSRRNNDG